MSEDVKLTMKGKFWLWMEIIIGLIVVVTIIIISGRLKA
jgi:hypothetical protein